MDEGRPLQGLRVVHLSTVHRLSDPRIRLKECRTLSDAGAQVRLIARSSPIEIKDDIDAVALPEIRSRFDRIVTSQRAALQLVREFEPDVVHFHDPELLVLAPLLRRIAPAVVYDVHESLPDLVLDREWIPRWGRKGVGAICRYLEPLLARACSAYVFVDARWAPRFAPRPWAEVANPPLADEFESVERSSPPVQPHFIYVGELLPERGVHGAVRAVNALDGEPRLTLAGPVADGLADELRALDTHGRLSLPGLVDRTTVHELLTGATAGLVLLEPVPAYDDATATKLFEYLSAGLPMIVSSTTAHRRFADEYGCAVVTGYDDDRQLGEAMANVVEPERWRQLHEAAKSASIPTWEIDGAPALLGLYPRVVDD